MESIMNEQWKPISGYDGLYMVSNFGRVKSFQFNDWRLLATNDNGNGYLQVGLSKNGNTKNHYVHRLVAEAFLEKIDGKNVVNHLDYDKSNNRADNLEWCTQKENTEYSRPNFKKQRNCGRSAKTGERYICVDSKGRYRVSITSSTAKVDKRFRHLDDAIRYRNEVCDEIGYTI